MKTIVRFCVVGLFLLGGGSVGQEITQIEFAKLHADLNPKKELWNSIPWHPDLLSGQRAAVEQNKPIFIWSMDGHPLACT